MTQDEIIRMAREAGIIFEPMTIDGIEYEYRYVRCSDSIGEDEADCIERFAALVAAHERNRLAWTQEHWTQYEHAIAAAEREKLTGELINEAQLEVQRAVLAEREACAKVCDAEGREWDSDDQISEKNYAAYCAAAIRARGESRGSDK